jgi:hypothetical protein
MTPNMAISEGDLVNWVASKGNVIWYSPSPRFEKLFALHTFQKLALEELLARAGVSVTTFSVTGLVSIFIPLPVKLVLIVNIIPNWSLPVNAVLVVK